MNDLGIVETTYDLEDGIDSTDVGQESISKTSTSRGTSSQPSNIIDGKMCRNSGLWVVFLAEPLISLIWNEDTRLLRLDGREGEVLGIIVSFDFDEKASRSWRQAGFAICTYGRVSERAFGDSLEESRLSYVCKTDLEKVSKAFEHAMPWAHTIPLFRLFPGRPNRTFSSLTTFFGGIFLCFA